MGLNAADFQTSVHQSFNDFGHFLNGLNPFSQNNQAAEKMFNVTNAEMMAKAVGAPPGSSAYSITTNPTLIDAFDNMLTGKMDYARTLETLQKEQAFQAEQNKINREFQEYMARNSHQIEAEDLRAIGLNPALTLSSGGANAYTASSVSSPGAREFNSGKGFQALMSLVMGLVSLGVNNARKVDAIDRSLDIADKKLNANIIQNDAKLNAMQAHWNHLEDLKGMQVLDNRNYRDNLSEYLNRKIKLGEARNSLAISDSYDRLNLDKAKFNANYRRGFRV